MKGGKVMAGEEGGLKEEVQRYNFLFPLFFTLSSNSPSLLPQCAAQLAKQQVLPAAQQISLKERLSFFSIPFFEMTCKCDTSHPE